MKHLISLLFRTSSGSEAGERMLKTLFWILMLLPFLGIVAMVLSFLNFRNGFDFWVTLGYSLLIGGAAYLMGGFTGFLFGLPRNLTNPDDKGTDYKRNDNLIQISDWVTKIIVGLSLTNLYHLPQLIYGFGMHYGQLFQGIDPKVDNFRVILANTNGPLIAESILIYYSISGFLLGYLWTNIHYIPILTVVDTITENLADKEKRDKALKMTEELNKNVKERVAASDTKSAYEAMKSLLPTVSDHADATDVMSLEDFGSMIALADQRMQEGVKAQSHLKVENTDPNQGRFGGQREHSGHRLDASIALAPMAGLFKLTMTVMGTSSETKLNDGDIVVFALHPSFPEPVMVVVAKDGMATVEVITWGAFTVGAVCDNGKVLLEYDLSTLPGAPREFIEN